MKTIEITEMPKYNEAAPLRMNLLYIGDTGIGKTQITTRWCEEHGYFFKTLILSQLDPTEALGIPVKEKRNFQGNEITVLSTAIPEWVIELAEHKDEHPVLFLDEFFCAKPGVQNAFLNFLSEKKVGPIDLSFVKVIAATNINQYTYDSADNIFSRFCCFYTVNRTAGEYVGDDRIDYHYEDINEMAGPAFDARSLKPRCYEILSEVKDNKLYYDFYEGYTNTEYIYVYPEEKFNNAFKEYVEKVKGKEEWSISESNAKCLAAVLRGMKPQQKNWNPICDKIVNMTPESVIRIRAALSPNVAKKVSGVVLKEDLKIAI